MHQTSMAIRVRHRRACVMPMPMHMHDKATQATPVGVICSGRPPCYHNAPGVMQRIPGGFTTWAGYIIWAGFIIWGVAVEMHPQLHPHRYHFVRVAGLTGILCCSKGGIIKEGCINSMITLRGVRTPHLLLSPRGAPPMHFCRL